MRQHSPGSYQHGSQKDHVWLSSHIPHKYFSSLLVIEQTRGRIDMSGGKSRKRRGKSKFVALDGYLYRSAAWLDLGCVERCLYIELKIRYDGFNNGRIGLGCREAAEALNVSRNTANRSFQTLERRGFIAVARPSGFNVKGRAATEYRLTEFKCDLTGELPTKDFTKWVQQEKSTVPPE